jgi:hypothetical protein
VGWDGTGVSNEGSSAALVWQACQHSLAEVARMAPHAIPMQGVVAVLERVRLGDHSRVVCCSNSLGRNVFF